MQIQLSIAVLVLQICQRLKRETVTRKIVLRLSGITDIYEINVVQKVNSLPHERSTGSTSHGTFSVPFVLFRLSVSTNL
jgi:hypothetical protein